MEAAPIGAIVMREDAASLHWSVFLHFRGNVVPAPLRHVPLYVQAMMVESMPEVCADGQLTVTYIEDPTMKLGDGDIVYNIIPDSDHPGHYSVAVPYLGSRFTEGPLPLVVHGIAMVKEMCDDIVQCIAKTYAKDHPAESAEFPIFHALTSCDCLQCRIVREND